MPRVAKPPERPLPQKTLIIDNGGYTIKAGFANPTPNVKDCHIIPNCLARDREKRVWIGSQLENCRDFGEIVFRRPVERGCLVNWEAEKVIWEHSFFDPGAQLKCDPHEINLLLSEAPNTPTALQNSCDQIVFEEFEFASYRRLLGASWNAYQDIPGLPGPPRSSAAPAECLLVIDSGFSHSTVTPIYRGNPIQQAIRRLDIGGKFLTNYLKEIVSIRHYNMSDETYIMNQMKEEVSFVSQNFAHDLEATRNQGASEKGLPSSPRTGADGREMVVDYVLPDYNSHRSGFMRPHDPSLAGRMKKMGALANPGGVVEDFMTLANERFSVPELLFNPGDVGMKQAGIPETVLQSLSSLPPGLWPAMLANILVVGGNANIDGFIPRLQTSIRQLAPSDCTVQLVSSPTPIKSTWLGGAHLVSDPTHNKSIMISRHDYMENGSAWLGRVFGGGLG